MPPRRHHRGIITFRAIRELYRQRLHAAPPPVLPPMARPRPARRSVIRRRGMNAKDIDRATPYLQLLGTIPDLAFGRKTDLSRSTIVELRARLHIGAYQRSVHVTDAQREEAVRWLRAGKTLTWTAEQMKLSLLRIRRMAREIGWDRSWVPASEVSRRSSTVGCMPVSALLKQFDAGKTLQHIAQQAGVSRERIRQVIEREGRPPRRIALARRAAQRAQRLQRYRQRQAVLRVKSKARTQRRTLAKLRTFLRAAQRQWLAGATIRTIAAHYGLTRTAMGWWIFTGRTRLGWFPRRQTVRKRSRSRAKIAPREKTTGRSASGATARNARSVMRHKRTAMTSDAKRPRGSRRRPHERPSTVTMR